MKRKDLFDKCGNIAEGIRAFKDFYSNPVPLEGFNVDSLSALLDKLNEDFMEMRTDFEIVVKALSTPSKELDEYNNTMTELNMSYFKSDYNTFDLIDKADNLFDKLTDRQKLNVDKEKDEKNNSIQKSENINNTEIVKEKEDLEESKVFENDNNIKDNSEKSESPSVEILNNENLKLWICGDTPKSIYGSDLSNPKYKDLQKVIEKTLLKLIKQGIKEFLVGVNRGFDLICLEIICKLKKTNDLKIHIVSPYISYVDRRTKEELEKYNSLINQADSIFYMDKIYKDNYNSVNELMKAKNNFLIDHAQYGLTMHIDGIENSVSNALSIAKGKTKVIFSIDKETLKVSKKK